jgi:hypothetical protein
MVHRPPMYRDALSARPPGRFREETKPPNAAFTVCELGRYKLSVPAEWKRESIRHQPPVHSLHLQPEPDVAIDFEVIDGLGTEESVAHCASMHRDAAKAVADAPELNLPVRASASLSVLMQGGSGSTRRDVYAFDLRGDLFCALLSYSKTPKDLPQLRRILGLLLGIAFRDDGRACNEARP